MCPCATGAVWKGIKILAMTLLSSSCSLSYYTKYMEEPVPRDWQHVAGSVPDPAAGAPVLSHALTESGRYKIRTLGPARQWSGNIGSRQLWNTELSELEFPAGPGEEIHLVADAPGSAASLELSKRSGEALAIRERGALQLSVVCEDGSCWVRAMRPMEAEVIARFSVEVLRPTRFTGDITPAGLVFYQLLVWAIMPPTILVDLIYPKIGTPDIFKPTEYRTEDGGVVDKPTGERVSWTAPVAGVRCEWVLELTHQNRSFRGSAETDVHGSILIPLGQYKDDLISNVDLGRSARLVVKEVASRQEYELAVDLIEILQGISPANRGKSGGENS